MVLVVHSWSNSLANRRQDAPDQTTSCKVCREAERGRAGTDHSLDYAVDWAIVQTQNWSTSYILSRERQHAPATVDVSSLDLGLF
jgi:hypothetical protein